MLKHKLCGLSSEKSIDTEKGIVPFILTERLVDRDSEVIEPKGVDIKNFKKNPVFLWAHDSRSPSIGRVVPETLKISDKRLEADVQFDLDDPFAAMIFNKFVKGFLNAGSIRFIPTKIGTKPVMIGQRGPTIEEWELLEFSAVPIPANAGALAQKDFGETEDGQRWYEAIKSFLEDDNFDHSPEGWVEKLDKTTNEEPEETDEETPPAEDSDEDPGDTMPESEKIDPGEDSEVSPEEEDENKAGRVLSAKNRKIVQNAISALQALLDASENSNSADEDFFAVKDGDKGHFPHHGEDGKADWDMIVSAMQELLVNKDNLSESLIKSAYEHLSGHYLEFDKEPPELTFDDPLEELSEAVLEKIGPQLIESVINELKNLNLEVEK